MKKIYSLFTAIALAAGFTSCSDNWHEPDNTAEGTGTVSLRSIGVEVENNDPNSARTGVDLSNFVISIVDDKQAEVASWTYSDMPELFTLNVGTYTVNVASTATPEKAAWEAPFFKGSKSFTIANDEITEVGVITCKLANVKVTVNFADNLKERLSDDVTVTVRANDDGELVFTPDNTKAGFFAFIENSMTLVAEFHGTLKGEQEAVTLRKTYTDVKAGSYYNITFSLKNAPDDVPDETGHIVLTDGLVLDSDVVTEDVDGNVIIDEDPLDASDRPGQEEPEQPSQPDDPDTPDTPDNPAVETITITSNDIDFTKVNGIDGDSYVVNIHADKGVAHLIVNISSNSEDFMSDVSGMGVPLNFDLAYPGADEATLAGFGFAVGSQIINQTDVIFDITGFVPLLGGFPGTHTFTLTVTDNEGAQISKKLSFLAPEE